MCDASRIIDRGCLLAVEVFEVFNGKTCGSDVVFGKQVAFPEKVWAVFKY